MNPVSSKKRERTKIVLVSDNDMVYGYAAGEPWAVGGAERFQPLYRFMELFASTM